MKLKVAIAQMRSTTDPWENLLLVQQFVQEAQMQGAQLICFPENVFYRGPKGPERDLSFLRFDDAGEMEEHGDFSKALLEMQQSWQIPVSLGSVLEFSGQGQLPYNTHALYAPHNARWSLYRKMHLFQYRGQAAHYDEAKDFAAGKSPLVVDVVGCRLALCICYDLRYPEFFRYMAQSLGAEVFLVPSAFTFETGLAHWHTLLRARAIENQSFVLASAQWGAHRDSRGQFCECFGESVLWGPWGDNLAQASRYADALLLADLDLDQLRQVRASLPVLKGARADIVYAQR